LIIAADFHYVRPDSTNSANQEAGTYKSNYLCESLCGGSNFRPHSGAITVEHDIASYRSLGKKQGIKLFYDSEGAFPRGMIGIGLTAAPGTPVRKGVGIRINVAGISTPVFITRTTDTQPQRQSMLVAASTLPTGVYNFSAEIRTYFSERASLNSIKNIKSDARALAIDDQFFAGQNITGQVPIYNEINSSFGAGWAIEEIFRISTNSGSDLSLSQGNGSVALFTRAGVNPNGDTTYNTPEGDFSTLIKKSDGTYLRTMVNKTKFFFNAAGFLIKKIDRNGNVVEYCLDAQNRLTSIKDEMGLATTFQYSGSLISSITDPAGRVTQLEYDGNRNLIRIVDPDQSERNFTYDSRHLMINDGDKNGKVASHAYNGYGQAVFIARADGTNITITPRQSRGLIDFSTGLGTATNPAPQVSASNARISTFTDLKGAITTVEADEFGAAIRVTDPLNRVTQITRDQNSNPSAMTDANGSRFTYGFDNRGNMVRQTNTDLNITYTYQFDGNFNQLVFLGYPGGTRWAAQLDAKGNILSAFDNRNQRIDYTYNKTGQILTRTDNIGGKSLLEYDRKTGNMIRSTDELGRATVFTYDVAGNVLQTRDPKGNITQYEYDELNRVTSVTDARNKTTNYIYDNEGNLLTVTDANNNVTEFTYDSQNRPLTKKDPNGRIERYAYDPNGNLIQKTTRKGQVIGYQYDAANQLVKKILPEGDRNFAYDLTGHTLQIADSSSVVNMGYDRNYRMTSASTAGAPFQPNITLNYTHDGVGNVTQVDDGVSPVTNIQLDDLFRTTNISSGSWSFNFGYDGLNRRISKELANLGGFTTAYTFDAASQLKEIKQTNASSALISSFAYKYDKNGNPTGKTESILGASLAGVQSFGYDSTDQLTSATNPLPALPTETFSYDGVGNRLRKTGDSTDNVIEANNQLTQDAEFIYQYDENGNLTRKTNRSSGFVTSFEYDSEDRLIQVTKRVIIGGLPISTVNYKYDGLGRRIQKDVDGVATRYIYDREHIRLEYSGALQASYVFGTRIDEPLIMSRGGSAYFYNSDALGSIRYLMNESGAVEQSYSYTSFGEMKVFNAAGAEIQPSQGVKNPFGYTGREEDTETPGLKFYRARYYDSASGRFLSEDPIGFRGGDENLYRYVFNQPTQFTDPSGKYLTKALTAFLDFAANQVAKQCGKLGLPEKIKEASKLEADSVTWEQEQKHMDEGAREQHKQQQREQYQGHYPDED